MHFIEFAAAALNFFEYVCGEGRPKDGFGIGIVYAQRFLDSQGQLGNAAEHSPTKALFGKVAETIVALARRLAVDLWRIATGRFKAGELGLTLRTCA